MSNGLVCFEVSANGRFATNALVLDTKYNMVWFWGDNDQLCVRAASAPGATYRKCWGNSGAPVILPEFAKDVTETYFMLFPGETDKEAVFRRVHEIHEILVRFYQTALVCMNSKFSTTS